MSDQMKIKQIAVTPSNEVVALTEGGDVYLGFFNAGDVPGQPHVGWRKFPPITEGGYEYKRYKELTPLQAAAAAKKAKNARPQQ